jgi:hypothetical protein
MFNRCSRRPIAASVCWSMVALVAAATATPAHAAPPGGIGPFPGFPPPIKCIVALGRWSRHADLARQFGDRTAGARVYGAVTLGGDLAGSQVQGDASSGVDGEFLGNDYDLIEATAHGDADRSVAHAQADLYVLGNLVRHYQVSGPSTATIPIAASWGTVLRAAQAVQLGPISVSGEAQLSVYGGVTGTAQLGMPVVKLDLRPHAHGDASASGGISLGPVGSVTGFGNVTLVDAEVPFTAEADASGLLACSGAIKWKIDGAAHVSGGGGSLGLRYQPPTIWPFPAPDPIEGTLLTLPSFTADLTFSGSGVGTI